MVSVEVDLEEVSTGVQRKVEFDAVGACGHCHGNGAEPGTPITTCGRCGGAGQLRQVTRTPFGQMVRGVACDACGGAGKVAETPCGECSGSGRTPGQRAQEIEIPAGIETASGCGSPAPAMPAARGPRRATSTSTSRSPRTSASSATAPT